MPSPSHDPSPVRSSVVAVGYTYCTAASLDASSTHIPGTIISAHHQSKPPHLPAGAHSLSSAANSRRSTIDTPAYLTSANTYTPHSARSHFFMDTSHTRRSHIFVNELVTPHSTRPQHGHNWQPDHAPSPSTQSHHWNAVTPQSLRSHLWRSATGSPHSMQTLASRSPSNTLSHHSGSLHSSQHVVAPHVPPSSRWPTTPGGLHRLGSLPTDAADMHALGMHAEAAAGATAAAEAAEAMGSPRQRLAKGKGPGDGGWWARPGQAAVDGASSSPELSSTHGVAEEAAAAALHAAGAQQQQQPHHQQQQATGHAGKACSGGAADHTSDAAAAEHTADAAVSAASLPTGLPLATRLANPGRFQTLSFRWVCWWASHRGEMQAYHVLGHALLVQRLL